MRSKNKIANHVLKGQNVPHTFSRKKISALWWFICKLRKECFLRILKSGHYFLELILSPPIWSHPPKVEAASLTGTNTDKSKVLADQDSSPSSDGSFTAYVWGKQHYISGSDWFNYIYLFSASCVPFLDSWPMERNSKKASMAGGEWVSGEEAGELRQSQARECPEAIIVFSFYSSKGIRP